MTVTGLEHAVEVVLLILEDLGGVEAEHRRLCDEDLLQGLWNLLHDLHFFSGLQLHECLCEAGAPDEQGDRLLLVGDDFQRVAGYLKNVVGINANWVLNFVSNLVGVLREHALIDLSQGG